MAGFTTILDEYVAGQTSAGDLSLPRIGYQNLFDEPDAVITASKESVLYPKENAYSGFLYDWWSTGDIGTDYLYLKLSSKKSANYFAVFGHNLGTVGSSVQLQYSDDEVIWVNATGAYSPAGTEGVFRAFDTIQAKYWRIKVNSPSQAPLIAVIMLGEALVFPWNPDVGFSPASLNFDDKYSNVQSQNGVFLGRSIYRSGTSGRISVDLLDPVWIRDVWMPFVQSTRTKPFVFAWDYLNHPTEVVYCWTAKNQKPPKYSQPNYMRIDLHFEALSET